MKSILALAAFLLFLFSSVFLNAQITTASQWTWMKGSNIDNAPGIYGTKGVPAAANTPGTRSGSVSWTDATGNLWLFGGRIFTSGGEAMLNDLWKYNPTTNQWTWMNGTNTNNQPGIYGTLGTSAAINTPGARFLSVSWTDAAGNLWLFGGRGASNVDMRFNDLWKYNPDINEWTWVNGANTINQQGVYGTQGTPAPANRPGAKYASFSWTDPAGNFWLYGGGENTYFDDLWKYNPATNQWAWMKGTGFSSQAAVYGTLGTSASSNTPGIRLYSFAWTDASGSLWLFGGLHPGGNSFNDLWKYDPATNQWTWINGASTTNQPGIYGTQGIPAPANRPGARYAGVKWTDAAGMFWLWGGYGYPAGSNNGSLNDLWKYDPATNQWTWINGANTLFQQSVYGTQGTPAATNRPSARAYSTGWTDTSGNFWLFSGNGGASSSDLWKLGISELSTLPNLTINDVRYNEGNSDTTTYTFTVSLSAPAPTGGISFNIATADGTATAGGDYVAKSLTAQMITAGNSTYTFDVLVNGDVVVEPNETFFVNVSNVTGATVTDGQGLGRIINDEFTDNPITTSSQWTWVKGDNIASASGIYGTQGVATAGNKPESRLGCVSWTDTLNNLWVFSGYNSGYSLLNDLWKYNPSTNYWTWINGANTVNQQGIYGTQGVASPANKPGSRTYSSSWTDADGNFWLFGGDGYAASGNATSLALNDLWKYTVSTNQWTWVNGDNTLFNRGAYGTQGIAASANKPGSRSGSVTWADNTGNLWLFGGYGLSANNSGYLNDLWKYNISTNQWTWINGANTENQPGIYGTQGVPATANKPGARQGSVAWTDASGSLWLFGGIYSAGIGSYSNLNDLWKYTPSTNQWTWVKGDSIVNQQGVYGTLGTYTIANKPGARYYGTTWVDKMDNLWLYGGTYLSPNNPVFYVNDLWKYTPSTNQWVWVKGDSIVNQQGVYGTQGMPSATNKPGARGYNVSWADTSGNFWMFGGNGYAANGFGPLNDLWKLSNVNVSFITVSNGNWNSPSTWAGGVVPSAGSIVTVRHNITVQANASCYSLRVEGPNGNVTVAAGVQFTVLH